MATLRLGDDAPDFTAETTEGELTFHDWKGDGWAVLFSHPADFTPVCTTELGRVAQLKDEWASPQHQGARRVRGRPRGPHRLEGRHRGASRVPRSTTRSSPTRTARWPSSTT